MRYKANSGKHSLVTVPAERPWQRLPQETPPAREAFETFLMLGVERTLDALAATGVNRKTAGSWSVRYEWFVRARHYDAHHLAEMARRRAHKAEVIADEQTAEFGKLRRKLVAEAETRDLGELATMDLITAADKAAGREAKAVGLEGGRSGPGALQAAPATTVNIALTVADVNQRVDGMAARVMAAAARFGPEVSLAMGEALSPTEARVIAGQIA